MYENELFTILVLYGVILVLRTVGYFSLHFELLTLFSELGLLDDFSLERDKVVSILVDDFYLEFISVVFIQ